MENFISPVFLKAVDNYIYKINVKQFQSLFCLCGGGKFSTLAILENLDVSTL